MTAYLTFPYQIDGAGRTATADLPTYVAGLLRLVLQTNPGERVNRPDFGAGLASLVFAGMDSALASAAETLIRAKLLQFMGDTIAIQTLQVTLDDASATVALTYTIAATGERAAATVMQALPGAMGDTGTGAARPRARWGGP